MKHGVLFEIDPAITRAVQNSAIASVGVDGGSPVVLGDVVEGEHECFTAKSPTATSKRVSIAYDPVMRYVMEGGQKYPGRSADRRDYGTMAGDAFYTFIPTAGMTFGVTKDNISGAVPTKGQFLEPTTDYKWATKATQTTDVASFEVIDIRKEHSPTGVIGGEYFDVYVLRTSSN